MIPSNYNDGKGIRPTKPDTGPFDLGKDFEKLFMEILFMWGWCQTDLSLCYFFKNKNKGFKSFIAKLSPSLS